MTRREYMRAYSRKYRAANREQLRAKRRAYYLANRERFIAKAREWRAANPAKVREQGAARRSDPVKENGRLRVWAHANRTKRRRTGWRFQGMDPDAAESALRQHQGTCDLCGAAEPGGRWNSWCVDHDHKDRHVRGVLCNQCNKGLALVDRVGLEQVKAYLQRGSARTAMKNEVDPLATSTGGHT